MSYGFPGSALLVTKSSGTSPRVSPPFSNVLAFQGSFPLLDGRDVELRGEVPSVSEAQRAERIVSMVRGVRVVRANMLVAGEEGLGGGET